MGSRDDSEEQFTLDTNYSPPATYDLGTQQLMARLVAEEEIGDLRADGVNDGKKQARKRKLITTRKPMLQSTLDGGSGSSARACSQKNVSLKVVIRGGRRKASTQALSSEARKKKGSSSRSQKNKKKIEEEIPDFDDDLEEVELDEAEIDMEDMENRQRSDVWKDFTVVEKTSGDLKAKQLEVASMVFSVTSLGTAREGLHFLQYGIGQLVSGPRPAQDGPAVYRQKTNPQRVGTGRDRRAQLPSLHMI
ncbi:hypothetical protein DY000_02040803 [Brassica cretica]|uniref:Uncharacterized protein n=1 Tax=Brassica cretica TaxID=69181 RepID=A0ABQ7B616_BRACR|nr:hypothetical protein DY000_02040803 [Brassica cretica]